MCGFLEEAHCCGSHAAHVAASVGGYDTEQALARFLGEVGLFEDAGGGVDVWEVESGAGVAGVEDGGQTDTGSEGLDHDAVHFVVDDVAGVSKVDWVDHFVVAVVFVPV